MSSHVASNPRQRRAHQKSRNGCISCKSRRVKCDEARPACGACIRFSLKCQYPVRPVEEQRQVAPPKKRGRPRNDWQMILNTGEASGNSPGGVQSFSSVSPLSLSLESLSPLQPVPQVSPLSLSPSPSSSSAGFSFSVEDMELFYHLHTSVCTVFKAGSMWRDKVFNLAFRHPCVLHMILGASALHLVSLRPSQESELSDRAEKHVTIGIRKATMVEPVAENDNCAALYITTVLACCCAAAKGPSPGHLLLSSDNGELAWWSLIRGLRALIETVGFGAIFGGILGPGPSDDEPNEAHKTPLPYVHLVWEPQLEALGSLIDSLEVSSSTALYQGSFAGLWACFQDTFGTQDKPQLYPEGRLETIMGWMYRLEDDFVALVAGKDTVALIILGHFAVILQLLEQLWYISGWARHILREVGFYVDWAMTGWLEWPEKHIGRIALAQQQSLQAGDSPATVDPSQLG